MERLNLLTQEEKAGLQIDDVRGFNRMHMGHIQRLYSEQVGGPLSGQGPPPPAWQVVWGCSRQG